MCSSIRMALATRIRRLGEHVVRGTTLLAWYYRTRPEALRFLVAPALAAFLVMVLAVVWGLLSMTLLMLVVVGTFAVFAVPFIDEIRSLEKVTANLDAGQFPWFAGTAEKEPEPSSDARTPEAEEALAEVEIIGLEPSVTLSPAVSDEPMYELLEVVADDGRIALQASANFLEVSNFASELIKESGPDGLEIVRVTGEERKAVWRYSRSESAAQREQPTLTEIFGFDPVRWVGPPTRPPRER
jgi:hypothetical protein